MDQTKSAVASTGVLGGVVALVAGVAGFFGYVLSPEDTAAVAGQAESIYNAVVGVTAAIGGLLAVWGRVKATKKIG
jgi:hypothetical protein